MGLLRKILGDPLKQSYADKWPALAQSWAGRQVESPEKAAKVNGIRPMGMLTKFMNPDAYASTGIFGGIQLNRELIEKENQDLGDVLMHEMTHANQGKSGFLRRYYEPNAVENEAIDAEASRKVRKTDIALRGNKIDPSINVPTRVMPTETVPQQPPEKLNWIAGMQKLRSKSLD